MTDISDLSKAKIARSSLWRRGNLSWKLDSLQQEMREDFYKSSHKINVWLASRRLGKSRLLSTIAIEICIKQPNAIVKYLAETSKQAREITDNLFSEIIEDAPKEVKPSFLVRENCWKFPNGSKIQFSGADNNGAEKLRGSAAHLALVDEAGFCDKLKYAVRTILLPTLLTTNGKLILSSTPPMQGDHEFKDFIETAEKNGSLIKKTIYDCPRMSEEFIQREIIDQYPGGKQNIDFRREYLVELIRSEEQSVIPEFTDELQEKVIKDWDRPAYYDCYVSADWGITDKTGILFAYYDFKNAKLVVEDELVMNGARMNTTILAQSIKDKERQLWNDPISQEPKNVYLRIGDNNLHIIQDLSILHQLHFIPTDKQNKEGFLNTVRVLMQDEKIIINPRCKNLISHIKYAEWDKNKRSFNRHNLYGHYDLVDALVYLVRNVAFTKNPYPKGSFQTDHIFSTPRQDNTKQLTKPQETIKNIFIRPKIVRKQF